MTLFDFFCKQLAAVENEQHEENERSSPLRADNDLVAQLQHELAVTNEELDALRSAYTLALARHAAAGFRRP